MQLDARRPATTFGAQLRQFRTRAGLTQEGLAERAGIGLATLKALEHDQRQRPHAQTVALLAAALGLEAGDREALEKTNQPSERRVEPPSPAVEAHGLPLWLTSFVGRENELAEVRALLDPAGSAARLLTLLGPGGVGKTRLAVTVGATLASAFPDGVVFVDLAPLSDARLVPATLARALDVRESSGRSARELVLEHLQPRQMLLVLDNFEHVLGAAPLLAELLEHCPHISLLTTSRTALRLRAERRFPVAPLPTPTEELESLADIARSPAVRLFVQRAHAVATEFDLNPSNASAVAGVCRRLDGMPLAIELAAARAGVLHPAALLQRLERRLPLLTRGAADLPQRQQTLRHTLEWSDGLLGPREQELFWRLAVFAGGASLDAIEAVCLVDEEAADDLLERLASLVDNCLVYQTVDADQEPRFRMLEIVREYAEDRLVDKGEAEITRQRHAGFYLELAELAAPELHGPQQGVWLQRLDQEHDNLRAALDWLNQANDTERALRLATAATWAWLRRGYFTDVQALIRLLSRTEGQGGPVRAAALLAAARLGSTQGNYPVQARYDAEALRIFRELGDVGGTAEAVTDLGVAMWQQGRLDEAAGYLQEGLQLFRTLGDAVGIATALLPTACVARDRGELEAARPLYAEARSHRLATGDQLGLAHVLNNLAWLELFAGQLSEARPLAVEAFAIRHALGSAREAAVSKTLLGHIALADGDLDTAAAHLGDSLETHHTLDNRWGIALALEGIAGLSALAQPDRALRLLGAAARLRAAIGRPVPPAEQPMLADWLAPARQARSADQAEQARRAGEALSDDAAVAAGLEAVTSLDFG